MATAVSSSEAYLTWTLSSPNTEFFVIERASTVQELFQARYGPGLVVIPHIATNKLLIYLPPPQEREKAGATGARSNLRTPTTRGAARGRTISGRGTGTTRTTR